MIAMALSVTVSTVGSYQWPRAKAPSVRRRPPVRTSAPAAFAASTMRSTLSSSGAENFGPTSTSVVGSPTLSSRTAVVKRSRNSSAIFSCRYIRSLQMQICPQFSKRDTHRGADGGADVGVLGDDERRLAAELEPQQLQVVGGVAEDVLAGADAAGERHEPGQRVA